ncbi:MAG: hypothetical protein QG585_386 [Patescibacteria group bacterium]|jgi:hypothetical protein|nr:hypothetical protein [Patescibacteria group bacterium]
MFNKTILKLSVIFLFLSLFDLLVIFYLLFRCQQTESFYYCDYFAFGAAYIFFGIPALILLGLALILLFISRFYKNTISLTIRIIFIVIGIIVFSAPYIPFLLPLSQIETYAEFNNRIEQARIKSENKKEKACLQYKITMSQQKEGQLTMPTPPSEDCI